MKMKKVFAVLAALAVLSGCSNSNSPDASDGSENAGGNTPDSSVRDSEPSGDPSESSAEKSGMPEELSDYINSLDNGDFVFVDYTFNDTPDVITDPSTLGGAYDRALEALKETDGYAKFSADFAGAEQFGRFVTSHEEYGDPIFKRALTDDFDRDGDSESFIMIGMPVMPEDEEMWHEREFLFLADESGAVLLDDYYNAEFTATLDYGSTVQLIVGSEGWNGNDAVSNIWQVNGGNAEELYGGRLHFSKTDCFLYSTGQQLIGDFAVYDINKGEYLAIQGKEISVEDIRAMDTDNVIGGEYDDILNAVLIGGKYFVINKNGVYTYENSRFERSDKKVRSSDTPGITGDPLSTLDDVDYDAALASMIEPENIGEDPSSGSNEKHAFQLYEEVFLDQQLLKLMEQDKLYVMVNLHIDEEALRDEYEERYPELTEDYYSWGRFLRNNGDQIIREFACDYNIDYEELESVFKMGGSFYHELDKDTISLMLNDTRVTEIIYSVGGYPVIVDF